MSLYYSQNIHIKSVVAVFHCICCAGVGGELNECLGGIAVMGATGSAAAASKVRCHKHSNIGGEDPLLISNYLNLGLCTMYACI